MAENLNYTTLFPDGGTFHGKIDGRPGIPFRKTIKTICDHTMESFLRAVLGNYQHTQQNRPAMGPPPAPPAEARYVDRAGVYDRYLNTLFDAVSGKRQPAHALA